MSILIDVWPGVASIKPEEVCAIEVLDDAARLHFLAKLDESYHPFVKQALTVIYLPQRAVFSILSWRELRNRLRKAGYEFI